jgi:hypothetical protein
MNPLRVGTEVVLDFFFGEHKVKGLRVKIENTNIIKKQMDNE